MADAAEVTKAILQEILVHGAESELEAVEFQDTVFAMNNYMTALDAKGVSLGYTVVSDLGDPVTVPAGALMGLIKNVALAMIPQFGGTIDAQLREDARFGMQAMFKLGTTIQPTAFPSTLPLGSGNENEFSDFERTFFPGTDENVLTETNQNIALESDT